MAAPLEKGERGVWFSVSSSLPLSPLDTEEEKEGILECEYIRKVEEGDHWWVPLSLNYSFLYAKLLQGARQWK